MRGAVRGRTARIDLTRPVEWQHPLNRGLVAWWLPLDGRLGNTLFDLTGRTPLTQAGSAYRSGRRFGTTSSSGAWTGTRSGSLWFGSGCTIAWVCTPSAVSGTQVVFRLSDGADAGAHWNYFQASGSVRMDDFYSSGFGNYNTIDTSAVAVAGTSLFYAYTYDGTTQRVYVNGALNNSATISKGFAASEPSDFALLGNSSQSQPGNALCDAQWAYSRALSGGEIAALYDQSLRGHPDTLRRRTPRLWSFAPAGGGVTKSLTGSAATASAGTVTPAASYALSGSAATGSAGTLSPAVSYALTGSAGTSASGTLTPTVSYALTGGAATGSAGTLTPTAAYTLSGSALSAAAGTLTPAVSYALSGSSVTGSAGSLGTPGGATLTGSAVTISVGTLTPVVSYGLSGSAATGSAGTLAPALTYSMTGSFVTVSAGTLTASGGSSAAGGAVGGSVFLYPRVGGTVTVSARVGGTVGVYPRVGGAVTVTPG